MPSYQADNRDALDWAERVVCGPVDHVHDVDVGRVLLGGRKASVDPLGGYRDDPLDRFAHDEPALEELRASR